ncbi:putative lipoprotein [Clostridioides difficile DA00195]|nr:putative lipoprotein [Clostridioides difficile DA00195]
MKAIEAKNKSKIILGCFLALLTLSCARTVYLTRDLDDKNSTQVNQVSSNKDKEDAEKKIKEETKNKRKLRKKEEIEKNSKEDNKGKVETKKQTLTGEELKKKVDSIIPAEYKGNYYTNDVLDTDGSYVLSLQVQNASFDNESSCKVFTKDLINKLKEFRIDSAEIYFVGSSGQTTYQINIDDFLKVQDNVNSVDNMEFFSFKDFKN